MGMMDPALGELGADGGSGPCSRLSAANGASGDRSRWQMGACRLTVHYRTNCIGQPLHSTPLLLRREYYWTTSIEQLLCCIICFPFPTTSMNSRAGFNGRRRTICSMNLVPAISDKFVKNRPISSKNRNYLFQPTNGASLMSCQQA